jgi:hypothetical protein
MARQTRSTYTVTELDPTGGPARSYNAIITPYSAFPPDFPPDPGTPPGGPPGGPGEPDLPRVRWVMGKDGWYFGIGPLDKPRPVDPSLLPPGVTYKWVQTADGFYFACGPFDKPQPLPPEGGGPGSPPVDPPANSDWLKPPPADGGWGFHKDAGWVYIPGSGAGPK